MRVILHLAEHLVPRLSPQVVDVVERLVETLDGDPFDHDALEDEGGTENATESCLE